MNSYIHKCQPKTPTHPQNLLTPHLHKREFSRDSIQGKSIKLDSAELESLFNFDFDDEDVSSLLPPTQNFVNVEEVRDYQPENEQPPQVVSESSTKARKYTNKVEFPSLPLWKSFDYSKVEAAASFLTNHN